MDNVPNGQAYIKNLPANAARFLNMLLTILELYALIL